MTNLEQWRAGNGKGGRGHEGALPNGRRPALNGGGLGLKQLCEGWDNSGLKQADGRAVVGVGQVPVWRGGVTQRAKRVRLYDSLTQVIQVVQVIFTYKVSCPSLCVLISDNTTPANTSAR